MIDVFEILSYLWHILGISLAYLGHILGISWAYLGHILERHLAHLVIFWGFMKKGHHSFLGDLLTILNFNFYKRGIPALCSLSFSCDSSNRFSCEDSETKVSQIKI